MHGRPRTSEQNPFQCEYEDQWDRKRGELERRQDFKEKYARRGDLSAKFDETNPPQPHQDWGYRKRESQEFPNHPIDIAQPARIVREATIELRGFSPMELEGRMPEPGSSRDCRAVIRDSADAQEHVVGDDL